jgi:phospho-N-acetylmuramoyl-pentapeptide-transferase
VLLWLTEYLSQYIGGFSVFQYLTLRTMVSVITALAVSLMIGPGMIAWLGRSQIGQQVRDDGPTSHFSKAGTPTMGGALILVIILVTTLLWGDLSNRYIWLILGVTLAFGAIGWVDDYLENIAKKFRRPRWPVEIFLAIDICACRGFVSLSGGRRTGADCALCSFF